MLLHEKFPAAFFMDTVIGRLGVFDFFLHVLKLSIVQENCIRAKYSMDFFSKV
jgi:hypothetical protein